MKIIYLGVTMGLIHQITPEIAQEIVNKGEVKEIGSGIKYVITYEDEI
jgi:hypothetical protein